MLVMRRWSELVAGDVCRVAVGRLLGWLIGRWMQKRLETRTHTSAARAKARPGDNLRASEVGKCVV